MPIFAVPISTTSGSALSRAQYSSLPVRNKRKRTGSPSPSDSDDSNDAKSQHSRSEVASTNPLSLTPAEVVQYRLAGLDLDEVIPKVKGFPHKGLPAERTDITGRNAIVDNRETEEVIEVNPFDRELADGDESGRKVDMQDGERKREDPPLRLRLQHLAVLTAILQRCLLEGDIPRASRGWAMLVRAQVGGRGMDLRASGYWAIGAELLIRKDEKPPASAPRSHGDWERDNEDDEEYREPGQDREVRGEKRYGTAAGLEKAKEYYERLILHNPWKKGHPHRISALNFWPAMVGCEIYGIQYEQKNRLQQVAMDEENEDPDASWSKSDSEPEAEEGGYDEFDAMEERIAARKRQKRAEKAWQARDQTRKTALEAYKRLAARLDELMQNLPYMDNQTLLRLRGMLALCIGDLMVPALPPDNEEWNEDEEHLDKDRQLGNAWKGTERRSQLQQRVAKHESGKKRQKEEHILARTLFERIEKASGRKEGVTDSLPLEEGGREGS